jgi:hypothetical protein
MNQFVTKPVVMAALRAALEEWSRRRAWTASGLI